MMTRCLVAAVGACGMVLSVLSGLTLAADAPLALVPKPLKVERKDGAFTLNKDTAILVQQGSADAMNVGKQLADRLNRSTGFSPVVSATAKSNVVRNAIVLTTNNANRSLGAEGYQLEVAPEGVVVTAADGPGLFYGTQTLLQLLPPQVFSRKKVEDVAAWTAPAVVIEDQPRFAWRGLMLDVSRHFFNKEEVKDFLDLMAQHKMNTFHWHLVDDQGWRIEIKHYPKLTEVGAWRNGIGFGFDAKESTAYGPDGRYGGFYTQDDIREVVAYAKDRYITIVPEIEMPGHSTAALAAYPELSCTGGPFLTDSPAGVHKGIYCAGNDAAFEFLENVLLEVIDLFPGKRIHIGGDEVKKDTWQKCEKCQARIEKEELKDAKELQSYFIRRIEKFVNAHGRTVIGWDEILEGGLAPNATVMAWRKNGSLGIPAVKSDHEIVMTPTASCYLDYRQAKTGEPKAIGGDKAPPANVVPLEKVYAFEPLSAEIPADKAKFVLGADGNLWSEYFPNYAHLQYMAYPRACAMAEVTWTEAKQKDMEDFLTRLETHLQRLKAQGANYRAPRAPQ
jgi:hexosaminidase